MYRLSVTLGVMLLLPLIGCASRDDSSHDTSPAPTPSTDTTQAETAADTTPATEPAESSDEPRVAAKQDRENIAFKNGAGDRAYEIKFKADGAKLVDPEEKELARFNVDGSKMKIKLPDDSVVAYIVAKDDELQIRDHSQKVELFELKRQSDGDWKLKDGNDGELAVIKKRDYGYEIEDGNEKSLFKSKLKEDKRSLRNASDETVLYTRDTISPLCVAVLGLEQIESFPMRTGLAAAVMLFHE